VPIPRRPLVPVFDLHAVVLIEAHGCGIPIPGELAKGKAEAEVFVYFGLFSCNDFRGVFKEPSVVKDAIQKEKPVGGIHTAVNELANNAERFCF